MSSFDGTEESFDLVSMLLAEQNSLTAVEEFASAHANETSVAAPEQARYYTKLMPASPPGPGQQLAFDVDLDSCSGCKACVVACHTMNGLDEDESWRRVGTLVIGEVGDTATAESESSPSAIGVQHVTTACHHCEDPGCLNGCPVKAYDKDPVTGIVRHLDDQCIGCKYCTMMCPYEVPKYSERLGIVRKCDMCHQRLQAGEAPACVQSCPNEAISIRIVETGTPPKTDSKRLVPGAPLSSITQPTTVYGTSRDSVIDAALPQDNRIDRPAENHWPLAVLLVATQIGVGMLFFERIVASAAWVAGSTLPIHTTKWVATSAWLISMVGMNLAPLHLGQPLRAWRVFLGLRTSWLSREAVLLGKFVGLLSLAVGLFWLPTVVPYLPTWITNRIPDGISIPDWAAKAALGGSILFGFAGLYSSAMIYIATKRVLWRHQRTLIRFFGTAVVAGLAFTAAALCCTESNTLAVVALGVLSAASLAAKLLWEQRIHLGNSGDDTNDWDRRSRRLVRLHLSGLCLGRLLAGWIGVAALAGAIALAMAGPGIAAGVLFIAASVVIAGGELAERLLYFSSVVHDRMPGTLQ